MITFRAKEPTKQLIWQLTRQLVSPKRFSISRYSLPQNAEGQSWLVVAIRISIYRLYKQLALEKNQDVVVKRESEGRRGQRKREVAVARHRRGA